MNHKSDTICDKIHNMSKSWISLVYTMSTVKIGIFPFFPVLYLVEISP